jgi:hypothetical protein
VVIDHLVYASDDLPRASAAVADLLGVTPTAGGHHVGHGTYNELLALGGPTYLEVIGPDPEQPAPDGPRPFGIDGLLHPALVAWCVRPSRPLAEIVDEARAAGIELGDVTAMSRRRPDGVLLKWKLTFPQLTGRFGMALPFMIDWGDSPHPTETLPAGVDLLGLEVTYPDVEALRTAFDIIGITTGVELREGPEPALRATIATQAGEVTMSG